MGEGPDTGWRPHRAGCPKSDHCGERGGEVRHWGRVAYPADLLHKLVTRLAGGNRRLHFCDEAGLCGQGQHRADRLTAVWIPDAAPEMMRDPTHTTLSGHGRRDCSTGLGVFGQGAVVAARISAPAWSHVLSYDLLFRVACWTRREDRGQSQGVRSVTVRSDRYPL